MKYKAKISGINADFDTSMVQIEYHIITDPKIFLGHTQIVCMNINDLTNENITKAIEEHEAKITPKIIKEHDLAAKWVGTELIIEILEQNAKGETGNAQKPD